MYSKKNLCSLVSLINLSYKNRKSCFKFRNFKGCINFLKILEKSGFISYFLVQQNSNNLGSYSSVIVYLRYSMNTGLGAVAKVKNVKLRAKMQNSY